MADLPDRIWARRGGSWRYLSFAPMSQEVIPYLASTPARERADRLVEALRGMLWDNSGALDHMTACEKTMGHTHHCTCGAYGARALLAEIGAEKEPLP